jgi:hypothetical protein
MATPSDHIIPHNCLQCPSCEQPPPEVYRRHWKEEPRARRWHVIAEGPDLHKRLPPTAHFLTILAYRSDTTGTPTQYRGSLYGEFDADPPPADAFADLRRLLTRLQDDYGCPHEVVRLWHSGRRGPHWVLPREIIGADEGHARLPEIYAAMAEVLVPRQHFPTADHTIYSGQRGRMWRLPNRRRADTGRYKVPLAAREVMSATPEALEALTVKPRRGLFWTPDEELSPVPALVDLYRTMALQVAAQPPTRMTQADPVGNDDVLTEGCRNNALFRMACAMRRAGFRVPAIAAALAVENHQRCQPPLDDHEIDRLARSAGRYAPHIGSHDSVWVDAWMGPRDEWHGIPEPVFAKEVR